MPEFRLPTTPEEWAAIEPNETDVRMVKVWSFEDPRLSSQSAEALAAASRLLERERCAEVLALHLWGFSEEDRIAKARRILEGGE